MPVPIKTDGSLYEALVLSLGYDPMTDNGKTDLEIRNASERNDQARAELSKVVKG